MTDKELRKLNRLELLELLLEASKENEKLKEKIEELKRENKTAQNIENLSVTTRQVETALKYANSLTASLKASVGGCVPSNKTGKNDSEKASSADGLSDKEIYRRILCFFAEDDERLSVFPADISDAVRGRIRGILERGKQN